MSEILISGPWTLLNAAVLELVNRGYAHDSTAVGTDGHDPKFLNVNDVLLLMDLSLVANPAIGLDSSEHFLLSHDWDDFIYHIDKVYNKRVEVLAKATEEEDALEDAKLSLAQHAINPFDPTGTVKDIDAATLDFLLACPKCGGYHSRHAGYFTTKSAYKNLEERSGNTYTTAVPVHVCVTCKTPIATLGGVVYDVSKYVDLDAWAKTEKEAHAATGPGGQC